MSATPSTTGVLSIREAERLRALARRVPLTNAGAQNNCGVMLARRGLALEAAACFERALDVDARMSLAAQNLQQLALRTSVDGDRTAQLTQSLLDNPLDGTIALALGKWHARLGRPTDAAAAFNAWLDHEPDDLAFLREIALVEQAQGYPDRASMWLEHAVELAPDDVALHSLAGEILYRRGKTELAKKSLERALEIDTTAAWPQHLLAFVLGDMGQLDEAQAAAQRAMELDPSLARVDMNLTLDARPVKVAAVATTESDTRAHLNLGLAYRNTGYFDQALAALDTALQRGEPAGQVYTAIADTRLLQQDWARAAVAYGEAAAASPGVATLHVSRAAALLRLGDVQQARAAALHALSDDKTCGSAYLVLGVLELLEHRPAAAISAFQRVRGSTRLELAARLNAAWVMRQLGRHADCLEGFRRVTEADAQNVRAWIGVGVAFSELRRMQDACSAFERATTLAPESADAAYHLAFTFSQLGRYQDGVRAMKRAMSLDSDFAPFRFLLVLDTDLPDVTIEIVANDAVSGDAMALMMLSGAAHPTVTAEHATIPEHPGAVRRPLVEPRIDATPRTPLGAWVALRRGGTPVNQTGVHRQVSRATPLVRNAPRRLTPSARVAAVRPPFVTAPPRAVTTEVPIISPAAQQAAADTTRNAERSFRAALAEDPDRANLRVSLAALLREDGRMVDAEQELIRALESVPTYTAAAQALAELREDLGRPSDAMQALVRPLRSDPRNADLLVTLASALLALGRDEQATSAVTRAAAVAPDHAGVRTLQGYMALRLGRIDDSLLHWRVALEGTDERWVTRARTALAERDPLSVPTTPLTVGSVAGGRR
jgi:tetratricopeptide (TPR) repeat protein